MEDKSFELLSRIYGELSEFRKETNSRLAKLEITVENDINSTVRATLDGYKQLAEGQEEIKAQLTDIQIKMENQDVEIHVLKGGKQRAT